ncbi:MAG: O-antigen ligase family protein [bacterium]|nr:O-antigen ligase family protein [bacterium]
MTLSLISILAFAITAGQLIRVLIGTQGITALDITVALFCLIGLLKIKFHLQKPPSQITAALIFIAVTGVSLIFTPLHLKPVEYIISFSYTIRFFLYVIFAWLTFSGAFGNIQKNLGKVFLLSGISFAVLGILQFIFFPDSSFLTIAGWDPHYFRTVSTFLDPNFAGAFLVLILLLLPALRGVITTKQSSLIFILVYLALLTTFSRSSYLMFLVSGLTFSFLKKSKIFAFATIILFVILLAGFQVYTNLVSEPRNIDRARSASFRLNTWQQGLTLFQSHPFLGVGFNSYRYALKDYNLGDEQFLQSHGSSSNDSSLLFVASTTGILGLLAYLYFLWILFKPSNGNFILTAGVAGLLIHSLFANSLFYPPILAWILLISVNPKK